MQSDSHCISNSTIQHQNSATIMDSESRKPRFEYMDFDPVRFMEIELTEIDRLLKTYSKTDKCTDCECWKHPKHLDSGNFNLKKILKDLKEGNTTTEGYYSQLLELCIGRLCFTLGCTLDHLKTLCAKLPNHNVSLESLTPPLSDDNGKETGGCGCIIPALDSVEIVKKLASIFAALQLEDSVQPSGASPSDVNVSSVAIGQAVDKNAKNPEKTCACSSHSDSESDDSTFCCDTCYPIMNILKKIATSLDDCLKLLSKKSSISSTMVELQKDILSCSCSQSYSIRIWCEALKTDCVSIVETATKIMERQSAIKRKVAEVQGRLNAKNEEHCHAMKCVARKCSQLSTKFKTEEATMTDWSNKQRMLREENEELVSQLNKIRPVFDKEYAEHSALKEELNRLTDTYNQNSEAIKIAEAEVKEGIKKQKKLQEATRKAEDEKVTRHAAIIENMKILTKNFVVTRDWNEELTGIQACVNERLQWYQTYSEIKPKDEETKRLEAEIKEVQEQLELITFYPETVPKPEHEQMDMKVEMECQIAANQYRMEILEKQCASFENSLKNLKDVRSSYTEKD